MSGVMLAALIACVPAAAACIALLHEHAKDNDRRHAERPVGDWFDDLIADLGMCPWCQVRECTDPKRCTCEDPCDMPLCRALEVAL